MKALIKILVKLFGLTWIYRKSNPYKFREWRVYVNKEIGFHPLLKKIGLESACYAVGKVFKCATKTIARITVVVLGAILGVFSFIGITAPIANLILPAIRKIRGEQGAEKESAHGIVTHAVDHVYTVEEIREVINAWKEGYEAEVAHIKELIENFSSNIEGYTVFCKRKNEYKYYKIGEVIKKLKFITIEFVEADYYEDIKEPLLEKLREKKAKLSEEGLELVYQSSLDFIDLKIPGNEKKDRLYLSKEDIQQTINAIRNQTLEITKKQDEEKKENTL